MNNDKTTTEKISPRLKEAMDRVRASLLKEVKVAKSFGFDVKSHWKEMLDSVEAEKAETK